MVDEQPPYVIDWSEAVSLSRSGRLMELLAKLPRALWAEMEPDGTSLLHYACIGDNVAAVVALLMHGKLAVAMRTVTGHTAAILAASYGEPAVLEALCAAGADVRERYENVSLLDLALYGNEGCVHVLVANGVRLSTVHDDCRKYITPELWAFERGVLCCRAAVVAMLRVKQVGRLVRWDRFLLVALALDIWATRFRREWQQK